MKMNHVRAVRNGLRLLAMILTVMILPEYVPACMAHGQETVYTIPAAVYKMGGKSNYTFSSETAGKDAKATGELSISGDIKQEKSSGGIDRYTLKSGNVVFSYSYDDGALDGDEDEWHLASDKSKKVDSLNLDKSIQRGAMILQTSLDGENWTEEWVKTDIFAGDASALENFYTTKYVQQQNGCYFRLIIVYKMEKKVGSHKVALIDVDDMKYKKYAEVCTFYIAEENAEENALSPDDTPRKELGKKINTGKDNGYAKEKAIDLDDPHYGWDIGTFFVNGYTRETDDNGRPVFLKNVGDKVTLWFRLDQDISCLNGNSDLSISKDSNGYDRNMEVPRTNFKRGTLIIRYTNEQGVTEDPVIYTDFLAANTKTGADTKVILFEEGDYEVSLDYEIKKAPLNVKGVEVLPEYSNYKIYFEFSIRNGNCMVYPFDAETGAELADNAVVSNGFRLDMARSRYLTIDVERAVLEEAPDGTLNKDVRFNRPAKDGETYTDEGVYTFTVKNLYTGESTKKTIYVGTDETMTALAQSGLSVDDWNKQNVQGR